MAAPTGEQLRRRREALGLSWGGVASATGIPAEYLAALERGDTHQLPPGYAERYARAVDRHLARVEREGGDASVPPEPATWPERPTGPIPTPEGLDGPPPTDPDVVTRPVPERGPAREGLPLPVVRGVAILAVSAFLGVLGWQLWLDWRALSAAPVAADGPVVVRMKMLRSARVRVEIDGRPHEERLFVGAEEVRFAGHREVALHVPDIDAVSVWMDDRRIRPRGRTGRERTLRFLADDREDPWNSAR